MIIIFDYRFSMQKILLFTTLTNLQDCVSSCRILTINNRFWFFCLIKNLKKWSLKKCFFLKQREKEQTWWYRYVSRKNLDNKIYQFCVFCEKRFICRIEREIKNVIFVSSNIFTFDTMNESFFKWIVWHHSQSFILFFCRCFMYFCWWFWKFRACCWSIQNLSCFQKKNKCLRSHVMQNHYNQTWSWVFIEFHFRHFKTNEFSIQFFTARLNECIFLYRDFEFDERSDIVIDTLLKIEKLIRR